MDSKSNYPLDVKEMDLAQPISSLPLAEASLIKPQPQDRRFPARNGNFRRSTC